MASRPPRPDDDLDLDGDELQLDAPSDDVVELVDDVADAPPEPQPPPDLDLDEAREPDTEPAEGDLELGEVDEEPEDPFPDLDVDLDDSPAETTADIPDLDLDIGPAETAVETPPEGATDAPQAVTAEPPALDLDDEEAAFIAAITEAVTRPVAPPPVTAPVAATPPTEAPAPYDEGEDDDEDEDTVVLDAPTPPPATTAVPLDQGEEPEDLPLDGEVLVTAPNLPRVRRFEAPNAPSLAPPAPSEVEVPWRALHPASLLVNLVPHLWSVLQQFGWPLVLLLIAGGGLRGGVDLLADLWLLGVLFLFAAGRSVTHFLTLRYRLAGSRLEIRSGLVVRNRRAIEAQKVQNVEIVRNVFHRMAGLAEIRIETASGEEVEGLLSALTEAEAEALRSGLRAVRPQAQAVETSAPPLLRLEPVDLFRYGATSTEFGGAAVVLGLLVDAALTSDPETATQTTRTLGPFGMVALVVAVAVGAWLVGIVSGLVRHHGFVLSQAGDALVVEEGLLTRRRVELPLSKVQRVELREPWLRRLFGLTSVLVETASARPGERGTQRAVAMVPSLERARVGSTLRPVLPMLDALLLPLEPPAPAALRRGLWRGALRGLLLGGLVAWWLGLPGVALGIGIVPASMALAWLDWRHQGWLVTPDLVVARQGWLRRTTTVVSRAKLQSVDVDQGLMMRRYGLGQVVVRVAGSEVGMPLLGYRRAWQVGMTLARAAGRPTA